MKKFICIIGVLFTTSCYAEFDIPAVKRHDPCTGLTEEKLVYVMPQCRYVIPRHPKDVTD